MRGPEVHGLTLNYRGGLLSRDDRTDPGAVGPATAHRTRP